MNKISFRNRISLYFITSTALLIFLVFAVLYFVVRAGVYSDLDNDLRTEVADLRTEITVDSTGFNVIPEEWKEKEHITLDINPIYIQFVTNRGELFDKSPNLKGASLHFNGPADEILFTDSFLDTIAVRQEQVPVLYNDGIVGYMIVATSLEEANGLLRNLRSAMLISYPLILMALYLIARLIAGRSIKPVTAITATAEKISKDNLNMRIGLPGHKDELYVLSQTINNLLDRIENAVEREKQFTSDASHELRTPLAVIKGTLEVLVRKPRKREEYLEKIAFCIAEVDRINTLVDQMLLLARFESQKKALKSDTASINALLMDVLARQAQSAQAKSLRIVHSLNKVDYYVIIDAYLLSIIFENLISNAIKYSRDNGSVEIAIIENPDNIRITISDEGIGIANGDLSKIFGSFYRSKPNENPGIKGTGLGLSIVKRLCTLLDIEISISSSEGKGTELVLIIKKKKNHKSQQV